MSDSIHITSKNFRNLTKKEIDDQYDDPNSELSEWARKKGIKRNVKDTRKQKQQLNQIRDLIKKDEEDLD